ncbi:MAG TPA: N-acetyl-gamma-glutamyl-phosphate reductase [Candidatus Dormibacteraeota bacterium]|nr:N-acetyl-gamma-glutamyl-phosphate reductase [Candidatus Dormibacteraeota bacterium]
MTPASGLRIRAAVAGATGYIGMQCVDLLSRHPNVEVSRLLARTHAGRRFSEVVPGSDVDTVLDAGMEVDGVDVVFAALPHTVAASQARDWISRGAVVVDMSADFRLRDAAEYERWYKVDHPAKDLCGEAVYALPELPGVNLADADLIAAPGCYPTATLLASVPALHEKLVHPQIVADCKSGVSGAGRSPALGVHFAEVNESVHAYGVEGHRHKAEMLQEMRSAAGGEVQLTFVPHLIPMTRGILATVYLQPRDGVSVEQIRELYRDFCTRSPFLRYDEKPPATKSVWGTNLAALNVSEQDGVAVVTCAIDNLLKGAAGQGVQALNLRFGFDETAGLPLHPAWP